jgi:hypothetical protein
MAAPLQSAVAAAHKEERLAFLMTLWLVTIPSAFEINHIARQPRAAAGQIPHRGVGRSTLNGLQLVLPARSRCRDG